MPDQYYLLESIIIVLCGFLLGSSASNEAFERPVAAFGGLTPTWSLVRRWRFGG